MRRHPFFSGHTCAVVDNLCVLFGGRTRRNRTNEVFLLDLNSLLWKQVSYEGIGSQYLPEGRVLHSMSAAVGESQKREGARFFIYGGLGNMCTPLADAWIFQLGTCTIDGIYIKLKPVYSYF